MRKAFQSYALIRLNSSCIKHDCIVNSFKEKVKYTKIFDTRNS